MGVEQAGHASITKTDITDYQQDGIFAFGEGTTLSIRNSNIVAAKNSELTGHGGIGIILGAKGTIDHIKISGNICNTSDCEPDFFTQIQGAGISAFDAAAGTTISNN